MSFTPAEEIVGFVDEIAGGQISGWAFDQTSADPLVISLVIDGVEVGEGVCDAPRPDVVHTRFGREFVGFHLHIPGAYNDGLFHVAQMFAPDGRLVVLRGGDGVERPSWGFTLPREQTVARMEPWQGGDIHGWAVVTDAVSGHARPADRIVVRQHGQSVATLSLTVNRPDVATRFRCAPLCGFVMEIGLLADLDPTAPLHFHAVPDGGEIDGSPLDIASAVFQAALAAGAARELAPPPPPEPPEEPAWSPPPAAVSDDVAALAASGLFDADYYLTTYPDLADADMSLFEHFFEFGYREGRKPNPYFDPVWYGQQNPEVGRDGMQPLLHFFLYGDREGQNPCPHFHTAWYRRRFGVDPDQNTLAHYLKNRFEIPLSPHEGFDADFYAARNPDVFEARVDMFDHFLHHGYREARNPSPDFEIQYYTQRYLRGDTSVNPLIHYWNHRHEPGVHGRMPDDETTVTREVKRFTRPGPHFEEVQTSPLGVKPRAMLLTYYLPQFHAFPENDAWWGKGFTEWTNIIRGLPRFVGHYQPRTPRDLGFYTLDSNEPVREQIRLARAAGVAGFVFYYYWFNGKRLMDRPVRRFLDDPSLDMGFALMWANENWTRRWDGAESEVLISQDYRPDDDLAMAADFAEHFRDPRYIRLQGRPVLMIYRAGIIPDCKAAIARWRTLFRDEFREDPLFIMAQAFNADDPTEFGFDAAIEFPPHKLTATMVPANSEFTYLDADFAGQIHRYDSVVEMSLRDPHPAFPLIKTAVPSWDNDARRQGTGMVITGSTPARYEAWLSKLVDIACANPVFGEPIVCVNAWNEWCEGAYLEPDLHYGGAYLNATARAVTGRARTTETPRLVLVGHDAFPSGAQHLLLNIGRTLRSAFGVEFEYLLLAGGEMAADYAAQGPLTIAGSDAQLTEKLRALAEAGFAGAIVNTTASGRMVPFLKAAGINPVLLVHELPRILREKQLTDIARTGVAEAARVVFPAPFVRDEVLTELGLEGVTHSLIRPQGSYKAIGYDAAGAAAVRKEFGLGPKDHLVLGVGYADLRKGFDLFLQLWRLLQGAERAGRGRICLVWVGGMDPALADWLGLEIAAAEATGTFRMAGYRKDMEALFSASTVLALTSREDPLPTVVMEALGAGAPTVAFDRSGGIPDMLRAIGEGAVVDYGDTAGMARAILGYIQAGISPADRRRRHETVEREFNFTGYVADLLDLALPDLARVSVAVPNYNYAQYMESRLGSIFEQTYPVREVLVLDDCSRDDSLTVIPEVAERAGRAIRLVVNETNSGSVFRQWRRAAEMARGDYVWIAEADDLCDPEFLTRAAALLKADPEVRLVFTDSRTVDADGTPQWESYKGYYETIEPGALTRSEIFEAGDFVRRFLAVKNLILNVSAVVWRRDALLAALDACAEELTTFKMAGDWLLYLTALSAPGALIGYEARPLNVHRRHANSVTHALNADRHVAEIARCHAVAAGAFVLPAAVERVQGDYVAEVAQQLGATSAAAPPPATGRPAGGRRPRVTGR